MERVEDFADPLGYPETASPATLWTPIWTSSSAAVEHVPFVFWAIDAVRPQCFVSLGLGSGDIYMAALQAISALSLPSRALAVSPTFLQKAGPSGHSDLAEFHDRQYASFSNLVGSGSAALSLIDHRVVDMLHVDADAANVSENDLESLRSGMSPAGVILVSNYNRSTEQTRAWLKLGGSFDFRHGDGLRVAVVSSQSPRAISALLQSPQDGARATRIRTSYAKLGRALRDEVANIEATTEIEQLEMTIAVKSADLVLVRQEVEALRLAAAAKDEQLGGCSNDLSRHAAEVERLHSLLNDRQTEMQRLESLMGGRGAEVERLHSLLSDRGSEVERLQSLLGVRESEVERLQSLLSDRESEVERLQSLLSDRGSEVERLQSLLSDRGSEVERLQSLFGSSNAEAERLAELVSAHEAERSRLTTELAAQEVERIRRDAEMETNRENCRSAINDLSRIEAERRRLVRLVDEQIADRGLLERKLSRLTAERDRLSQCHAEALEDHASQMKLASNALRTADSQAGALRRAIGAAIAREQQAKVENQAVLAMAQLELRDSVQAWQTADQRLASLSFELQTIVNSTSWKMTGVARRMGTRISVAATFLRRNTKFFWRTKNSALPSKAHTS